MTQKNCSSLIFQLGVGGGGGGGGVGGGVWGWGWGGEGGGPNILQYLRMSKVMGKVILRN